VPAHFVLDQNFPWQATGLSWPPSIRVTPLAQAEPALIRDVDDWQIFLALHRRGDVDGFITNDAELLALPTEMSVLARTRLTLVVTAGEGHRPIEATGLVMVYLRQISTQMSGAPQIFLLRPRAASAMRRTPFDELAAIGKRRGVGAHQIIQAELSGIGLAQDLTSQPPTP
jgi:hypothetical protein